MNQLNHRTSRPVSPRLYDPKYLRRFLGVLGFATVLAGLACGTGCGSTKITSQTKTSVGQQLTDLDKAYKDGVITEKEYQKLKRRIIKEND